MKPLQWKEFFRCVRKTKSRFISMMLIAALGVAFYVGIRASGPDMEISADAYYDETNLMDIRVLGTLGMTDEDVAAIREIDGVTEVQGAYGADVLCDIDGIEYTATLFSLCDSINQMTVEQGRLPEAANECFADALLMRNIGLEIGDTITFKSGSDDPLEDTLAFNTLPSLDQAVIRGISAGNAVQPVSATEISIFSSVSPQNPLRSRLIRRYMLR